MENVRKLPPLWRPSAGCWMLFGRVCPVSDASSTIRFTACLQTILWINWKTAARRIWIFRAAILKYSLSFFSSRFFRLGYFKCFFNCDIARIEKKKKRQKHTQKKMIKTHSPSFARWVHLQNRQRFQTKNCEKDTKKIYHWTFQTFSAGEIGNGLKKRKSNRW